MKLPSFSSSAETLTEVHGLYHLTRLQADPTLEALATTWGQSQGQLEERIEHHRATKAASMTAMAIRDGQDAVLDERVRVLSLGVLSKINNNRNSPYYSNYFPNGTVPVVGAPLEIELQKVGVILAKLAEEEDASIQALTAPLSAAYSGLKAAVEAHKTAMAAEVQAYGLVQTAKIQWFDAYKRSHRELQRLFYKDPKKAETYFKPPQRESKEEEGIVNPPPSNQAGGVPAPLLERDPD